MLRKLRWLLFFLLVLVVVIIAMQNLDSVKVHVLVYQFDATLATLLVCAMASGFIFGLSFRAMWRVTSWSRAKISKPSPVAERSDGR